MLFMQWVYVAAREFTFKLGESNSFFSKPAFIPERDFTSLFTVMVTHCQYIHDTCARKRVIRVLQWCHSWQEYTGVLWNHMRFLLLTVTKRTYCYLIQKFPVCLTRQQHSVEHILRKSISICLQFWTSHSGNGSGFLTLGSSMFYFSFFKNVINIRESFSNTGPDRQFFPGFILLPSLSLNQVWISYMLFVFQSIFKIITYKTK